MTKLCDDVVTDPNGNSLDCLNCKCLACTRLDGCDICPAYGCPEYPHAKNTLEKVVVTCNLKL